MIFVQGAKGVSLIQSVPYKIGKNLMNVKN